jgi:hypothetical protein
MKEELDRVNQKLRDSKYRSAEFKHWLSVSNTLAWALGMFEAPTSGN